MSKKQASLFGTVVTEENVIYPKGPANYYEKFIEYFYYLNKSTDIKKHVISKAQKEWKDKFNVTPQHHLFSMNRPVII